MWDAPSHPEYLLVDMAPAPAIAGGKALRAFADCRRQKQTGKTGNKVPIKSPKMDNFFDLKLFTKHVICENGPIKV